MEGSIGSEFPSQNPAQIIRKNRSSHASTYLPHGKNTPSRNVENSEREQFGEKIDLGKSPAYSIMFEKPHNLVDILTIINELRSEGITSKVHDIPEKPEDIVDSVVIQGLLLAPDHLAHLKKVFADMVAKGFKPRCVIAIPKNDTSHVTVLRGQIPPRVSEYCEAIAAVNRIDMKGIIPGEFPENMYELLSIDEPREGPDIIEGKKDRWLRKKPLSQLENPSYPYATIANRQILKDKQVFDVLPTQIEEKETEKEWSAVEIDINNSSLYLNAIGDPKYRQQMTDMFFKFITVYMDTAVQLMNKKEEGSCYQMLLGGESVLLLMKKGLFDDKKTFDVNGNPVNALEYAIKAWNEFFKKERQLIIDRYLSTVTNKHVGQDHISLREKKRQEFEAIRVTDSPLSHASIDIPEGTRVFHPKGMHMALDIDPPLDTETLQKLGKGHKTMGYPPYQAMTVKDFG